MVASPPEDEGSSTLPASSSVAIPSSIPLLTDVTASHNDFIQNRHERDRQVTGRIQLGEKTDVSAWDRVTGFKQHLDGVNLDALLALSPAVVKPDSWREDCVVGAMESLEYECRECVRDFSRLMQRVVASPSSNSIGGPLRQLQDDMYVRYRKEVAKPILYVLRLHAHGLPYSTFGLRLSPAQEGLFERLDRTLGAMEDELKTDSAGLGPRGCAPPRPLTTNGSLG